MVRSGHLQVVAQRSTVILTSEPSRYLYDGSINFTRVFIVHAFSVIFLKSWKNGGGKFKVKIHAIIPDLDVTSL
jgi:hypothetical protein